MKESVSVIIPTCNRSHLLPKTIASVLSQTFEVSEILIIDDFSDSEHLYILDEIVKKSSLISVLRQSTKKGVSACRNIGLDQCKGEYIIFLDDDDTLHPNMVEDSILKFRSDPSMDAVGCRGDILRFSGADAVHNQRTFVRKEILKATYSFGLDTYPGIHFLMYHPLIHSLVMKRKMIGDVRFPTDLVMGEDCYFFLTLIKNGATFGYIEKTRVYVRIHHGNNSHLAGYDVKEQFYKKLLASGLCGKKEAAIVHMQLFYTLLKKGKPSCIPYFFKGVSQPIIFYKFIRYQLRIRARAFSRS